MPDFKRFNPTSCNFPKPRVPVLPGLQWGDITFDSNETTVWEILAGPGVRHFARGRYAMHAAYKAAGVGPNGALLAPAYHCRTMLDPALALGGTFLLYRLNANLTPQLDSIKALVATSQPPIKALVVTHYFGFSQPHALLNEIAELCSQSGITLVEDCSHAWLLAAKKAATVRTATQHVLIASPYKFFACEDGGTLWGNPAELPDTMPNAPGWLAEVKALRQALQRSLAGQRADQLLVAEQAFPKNADLGEDVTELSSSPSIMYDARYERQSSLALSRWVMRHTKLNPVVQQRKKNYRQWLELAASLRSGKALFPNLPPGCAPYMFPLLIEKPEQHFYQLKHMGVPIWRWDEMAVSDCLVANQYRLSLLHLPCNQRLTPEQMQWMTAAVSRVLS